MVILSSPIFRAKPKPKNGWNQDFHPMTFPCKSAMFELHWKCFYHIPKAPCMEYLATFIINYKPSVGKHCIHGACGWFKYIYIYVYIKTCDIYNYMHFNFDLVHLHSSSFRVKLKHLSVDMQKRHWLRPVTGGSSVWIPPSSHPRRGRTVAISYSAAWGMNPTLHGSLE